MTSAKLLLIRHGESSANVAASAAELDGAETIAVEARDADVALSELGEQQATALGSRLQTEFAGRGNTARVWSSPYRRAISTARIALGDTPIAIDERLRDRELGVLDALTVRGVDVRLPAEAARRRWLGKFYYRPPGGEAWTDVALRIRSFLRDLDLTHGQTSVIFTHDAVVTLFLYVLLGWSEGELDEFLLTRAVGNASLTTVFRDDAGWRVDEFADVAHLADAGLPATEHPGAARVTE